MGEAGFDNITSFPRIDQVRKRDGELVSFNLRKIAMAVGKAMSSTGEGSEEEALFVARSVQSALQRSATVWVKHDVSPIPGVEVIQDAVERELMLHGFTRTAKAYILYRQEHAKLRAAAAAIPPQVRELVENSKKYFRNPLAEFIYFRTYSRWIESEGRRETWIETVDRYMKFMMETPAVKDNISFQEYEEIRQAILNMEVMPSMRLMWSAGDAARTTNVAAFNCSFIAPTCIRDLAEILYILACGTGVGFSVESRNVQQFPVVLHQRGQKHDYVIGDSKEGWADALIEGLEAWYDGRDVNFDFSLLRPEGARLKTMGGRSSGPKPLIDLLAFCRQRVLARQGRRLSNLDLHDIICKIGDCIVAGGVRRSALISLSDLDDGDMRRAKEGHFWIANNHRQLANNSAVYERRPSDAEFLEEWLALVRSGSGERGIFNRQGLIEQIPERRLKHWLEQGHAVSYPHEDVDVRLIAQVGTNPCGEINLLSKQFCNLTEVVCRLEDKPQDLRRKVRIAAILGTYQSMLTNYPYLSDTWTINCERERLLGVSLTGQWDCAEARRPEILTQLRDVAVETNREYAAKFGISRSTAVTCGKPSGTVSQQVDAASGGHARFAPFYIRRVRIAGTDPLFLMLKDHGIPYFPEVGFNYENATTFVLEFPVKSPEGSVYSRDLSALEQLEHWKKLKTSFTEHNPSVTISVGPDEWIDVQHWVWSNWNIVGGLSFLPRDDHVYQLAPYEEITEEKYTEMLKAFEGIDYSRIIVYEKEDATQGSKELACVAGVCEI